MGLDRRFTDLPVGRPQRTRQQRIGAERFEAGWRSGAGGFRRGGPSIE